MLSELASWQADLADTSMECREHGKKVNVIVTDDIDSPSGALAVSFSLDGQGCELDLGPANRQQMQESLQPFIDAGRKIGRRTQRGG